jgi:hypothetical protein
MSCCAIGECFFPDESFVSLMARSSCSLQTLSLENLIMTDKQFIACLRAAPSLCELSSSDVSITNEAFRMLYASDPPNANKLLPNLKVFKYLGNIDLDFSVLACLLRSWWNNRECGLFGSMSSRIIQVESVMFQTKGNGVPDDNSLAQLRQLISEGMQIGLSTADRHWF